MEGLLTIGYDLFVGIDADGVFNVARERKSLRAAVKGIEREGSENWTHVCM